MTIRTALLTATILALSAGNSAAQTARTGAMMREKHTSAVARAIPGAEPTIEAIAR